VNDLPIMVACAGCGAEAPDGEPYPFRCPNSGRDDDIDHVMALRLDPARLRFPTGDEPNPFIRYRTLFYSYHVGRAHGLSDEDYVALVEGLDQAVAAVDGRGFRVTPFGTNHALSGRLGFDASGSVWVKDETGNVSGSHKARHLVGLLIHMAVVERAGLAHADQGSAPRLAIASCGNAALAAAVVARAAGRALQVFVPPWADPPVVERLRRLGAHLTVCPREHGVPGDPTHHRLQQAVRDGALPFTCQGPDNGLTIEGGKTLGYEMVSQLARTGGRLDRLFVQAGGGALASACIQGLDDAVNLGALAAMPRIHAVQTQGGYPLRRAYDRVVDELLRRLNGGASPAGDAARAEVLLLHAGSPAVETGLRDAAAHRRLFMWPWEHEPKSVAHGILDDETYDWMAVVRGMIATGGYPVVVAEESLLGANDLARTATGIDVDHTGSAGMAGLIDMRRRGEVGPDETVAVVFTGVRR
jgi:threonine synthase